MEDTNVAVASGWLRSLKLDNAADICIAHGIDGFVLFALLEEEGGLESIGITSVVDKAKVRGEVRKMMIEVGDKMFALTYWRQKFARLGDEMRNARSSWRRNARS